MKRVVGVFVVVALGLALGAWGRAYLPRSPEPRLPALAFTALFEKYCVPVGHGLPHPDLSDLVPVEHVRGKIEWIDAASGFQVHFRRNFDRETCFVGEYTSFLTQGERNLVGQMITRIVAVEYPDLVNQYSTDSMGQYWMRGPVGTRERWGVAVLDFSVEPPSFVVTVQPPPD